MTLNLMKTHPVHKYLNSPEVVVEMSEEDLRNALPRNQVRELDYRQRKNLPYSFYYDEKGKIQLSHRADPYMGLG